MDMRILLTLDGTAFAERGTPVVRSLATVPNTEVHLLAVMEPVRPYQQSIGAELVLEHYLEDVARLFPENVVCIAVRVGPHPADQIAAYAQANEVDRIVIATHGRSSVQPAAYGSVAEQVVRAGVAPVRLVQPTFVA
jgi:nucleotide-binding universal stress UspA family protein